MMRSMFAAISGLKNHQTMLDVTANDIANVNTIGYKSSRTTFKDSLAQLQRGGAAPSAAQGGANPAQVGLGSQLSSIDNIMTTGTFQSTGSATDVGIQGEGFFVLAPDAGNAASATGLRQYTRAGNFTTNANGDLVTQDGFYVRTARAPRSAIASRPATCSSRSSPTRRASSATPATAGSSRRPPAPLRSARRAASTA
jgi:flagellar hook protein FlgE